MAKRALLGLAVLLLPLATMRGQVIVTGRITDSLSKRPVVNALVQIAADSGSSARSAYTDSLGTFRIDSVRPGGYLIGFFHPTLDSLGIDLLPKHFVAPGAGEQHVDLAIPSPHSLMTQLCRSPAPSDSTGILLGHVRDAASRQPRVGSVTIVWWELIIGQGGIRRNRQQFPVKTDSLGYYALCGVPADAELTASAVSGDQESGFVQVRVPLGGLQIRDFLVSRADSTVTVYDDSAGATRVAVATLRRGRARITGQVHTDKGKPVSNADVAVPGTGLGSRTQETGAFSLGGLPAGTQSVEVRAIGYEPKRVTVDLARDSLTTLDVVLDRPVQTLDAVKVYGKGNTGINEFMRRARSGWGHVLTPQQIAKRNALQATDLFRMMPGVRVSPSRGFGNAVTLRGGCMPTVYMNGMRMDDSAATEIDQLASPSEITAVEVYNTAGRPAQFWGNNCGSVVLWVGMMPR
jgi:hypothetical protein